MFLHFLEDQSDSRWLEIARCSARSSSVWKRTWRVVRYVMANATDTAWHSTGFAYTWKKSNIFPKEWFIYCIPLPTKTDKNNRFKKNTMFWMQTRCFHFLCFFESVIFCSFLTWTFAAVFNSTLVVLTPPKVTLGLNQRVNCQDLYSKFQDVLFNACVLFILRYSPAGTH